MLIILLRQRNVKKNANTGNQTHCNEAVAFGPSSLGVHDELDVVNLSEGLKNASQHVFGDVEV